MPSAEMSPTIMNPIPQIIFERPSRSSPIAIPNMKTEAKILRIDVGPFWTRIKDPNPPKTSERNRKILNIEDPPSLLRRPLQGRRGIRAHPIPHFV